MIEMDLMISIMNHSQTDDQFEHMNRSILQILHHYVNTNESNSAQHLSIIEFAINSIVS